MIKINADLERVGDQAVNISERVRDLEAVAGGGVAGRYSATWPSLAAGMVRKALQAFIEGDAEMARAVLTMDDSVDKHERRGITTLCSNLMKDRATLAPQALNALMICAQPGAGGRPRNQHRRRRHLLGGGLRRSSPQERDGTKEAAEARG